MENVLEILDQKVEKGFFKLIGTPEGMVCNCSEMYVDEYRIMGVVEVSKDSLKPTIKWVYKEKVRLDQFSKKIKKESKGLYVIKESGLGYSRDFIRIALLILDRKKTMVDLPSEPSPLRMYDDKFAIYLAPRIEMSEEEQFSSDKAEIEASISYLLKLTDSNNKLREYMKEIFRSKRMSKRNLSEFLIMFKKIEELIGRDYIEQKDTLRDLVK